MRASLVVAPPSLSAADAAPLGAVRGFVPCQCIRPASHFLGLDVRAAELDPETSAGSCLSLPWVA